MLTIPTELSVPLEVVRAQLQAVGERLRETELAWDIALGFYRPSPGDITPMPLSLIHI